MTKIESVLLIDDSDIDNFINHKTLEIYGVTTIFSFKNANTALSFLTCTNIKFQFIIVDLYLPIMDGFQFFDKFKELDLHKKQGELCLLSASINPLHKQQSAERNIRFIEKPLTIKNLLMHH